jgi:restriction system protein
MRPHDDHLSLDPREYELAVKGILDAVGNSLVGYESSHLEELSGTDGDYIIDIVARFSALGASFLVLVECKHHRRNVERQDVQVLHAKLQSVGAQKAILFTTSGFQSGAIDYAETHGIALVQFASGESVWFTKSAASVSRPPAWVGIPKYVGWWHHGSGVVSVLSEDHSEYTRQMLAVP